MSNKLKEKDKKNCTCYFFDDMVNMKNNIKIEEKFFTISLDMGW